MEERFELFTLLLSSISRSIHKIKTEEMKACGLKSSHLSCIYYLYQKESLTASELCEYCEEDKANISRAVKHLEENGYLVCYSKTAKRYQCPMRLTERGEEVAKRICMRLEKVMEAAGLGISDEERIHMYHALAKISDNLEKFCEGFDKKSSHFSWKSALRRLKRASGNA